MAVRTIKLIGNPPTSPLATHSSTVPHIDQIIKPSPEISSLDLSGLTPAAAGFAAGIPVLQRERDRLEISELIEKAKLPIQTDSPGTPDLPPSPHTPDTPESDKNIVPIFLTSSYPSDSSLSDNSESPRDALMMRTASMPCIQQASHSNLSLSSYIAMSNANSQPVQQPATSPEIKSELKSLKTMLQRLDEQEMVSPRVKILANTRAILQNTSNILANEQDIAMKHAEDMKRIEDKIDKCMRRQKQVKHQMATYLDINMKILYKVDKMNDIMKKLAAEVDLDLDERPGVNVKAKGK